jgi:hypothetical protein
MFKGSSALENLTRSVLRTPVGRIFLLGIFLAVGMGCRPPVASPYADSFNATPTSSIPAPARPPAGPPTANPVFAALLTPVASPDGDEGRRNKDGNSLLVTPEAQPQGELSATPTPSPLAVSPTPSGARPLVPSATPSVTATPTPGAMQPSPTPTLGLTSAPTPASTVTPGVTQASPTPTPGLTPVPISTVTPTASGEQAGSPDQTGVSPCQNSSATGLWLDVASGELPLRVGEETTVRICASALPEGLAGFDITLSLQTGGVAEIISASYPPFGLTKQPTLPSGSARLRAVDLEQIVSAGAKDVLLATLRVRAKLAGTTALSLSVNAMDDDDGNRISLRITPSSLRVSK